MDAYNHHDNNPADSITAFDTLYTTNEIQLLKVALPLISRDFQPLIAAFVKARELSYCYQMIRRTKLHTFSIETANLEQFFKEAKVYCTEQQRRMFEMFETLQKTMRILEKMQVLSDGIPFDGDMDITKLMQLMPLINPDAQIPNISADMFKNAADLFGGAAKSAADSGSKAGCASSSETAHGSNVTEDTLSAGNAVSAENTVHDGNMVHDGNAVSTEDTVSDRNAVSTENTIPDGNAVSAENTAPKNNIPTENVTKNNTPENNTPNNNIPKNNTPKSASGTLPPLLANALTGEQREMYEKFKQKFSSM